MDWRIKAATQGLMSRLPGGAVANDLLQRLLGGRRDVSGHIRSKVEDDWLVHMSHLRLLGFDLTGRHLLEVGTGWLPVMPLCFALAGIGRVTTIDLNRHLRPGAVHQALQRLQPYLDAIARACGAPPEEVRSRWESLAAQPNERAVLEDARIDYQAPGDATRTGLPARGVDIVFSNSVLEHMPKSVLDALMVESRRILADDGFILHGVNCGDHYSYFDRSITPIHYLRFTEREWLRWNNDLLYQNRLRPIDFLDAAHRAGFEVVLDTQRPRPELLNQIAALPIAPAFRNYDVGQLCTTSIDFAARPRTDQVDAGRTSGAHART